MKLIVKTIKKIMKSTLKKIYYFKYYFSTNQLFKNSNNERSRFILIGSPEHGNLGDHAISIAEIAFLKEYFFDREIIEISANHFISDSRRIANHINSKDIILITGGGFMGSLWLDGEIMTRTIVNYFPDNHIVIFPQTVYFEKTEYAQAEKETSMQVYKKHKNLSIALRDKSSFDFMNIELSDSAELFYSPDIVTFLNMTEPKKKRESITFCIRQDRESTVDQDLISSVKKSLIGYNFNYISTVVNGSVSLKRRNEKLELLLDQFRTSKIVITDRLHGMLFAAITGTPCVALDNLSRKVSGVYIWIKYLPYIRLADNPYEFKKYIDDLLQCGEYDYDNSEPTKHLLCLRDSIKKKLI